MGARKLHRVSNDRPPSLPPRVNGTTTTPLAVFREPKQVQFQPAVWLRTYLRTQYQTPVITRRDAAASTGPLARIGVSGGGGGGSPGDDRRGPCGGRGGAGSAAADGQALPQSPAPELDALAGLRSPANWREQTLLNIHETLNRKPQL